MIDHLCWVCKEIREPEVTTEFKDGVHIEFKHCPDCGSDVLTPVDELADGTHMEDDR